MSSGLQEDRARLLEELRRELRQFQGLAASFFRAAAARAGMTVTDMEVIESLAAAGPTTAGQLAELTGLTTGAITGMLNRLEEAGLVRRERDPADGRRVIVQLATEKGELRDINAIFDSLGEAWDELIARYDDGQIALLLEVLEHGNALSREEIVRLREAPADKQGMFSAPLGAVTSGQLVTSTVARLTLRAGGSMEDLYRARFEGPVPEVRANEGVVSIRYPRRLWFLSTGQHTAAEVILNTAIPWQIAIKGGASDITAELAGLDLAGLELKGGMSMIRLELPAPSRVVPIHISGGASQIIVRRPAGVATRVHLKGWVSEFIFDDRTFSAVGNDVRWQSPGEDEATRRYDIEVASSASMVTITAN